MHKLDGEILAWIAKHCESGELRAQIESAEVVKRDYMRTGYFVYFDGSGGAMPADKSLRVLSPDILSAELMDGAGTTLFLRDGRLHYLEIYARGGFFPEELGAYELVAPA